MSSLGFSSSSDGVALPGAGTDSSSGTIHTIYDAVANNTNGTISPVVIVNESPDDATTAATTDQYGATRRPRPLTPRAQSSPFPMLAEPYTEPRHAERVSETRVVPAQAGDIDMAAIMMEATRKRNQQADQTITPLVETVEVIQVKRGRSCGPAQDEREPSLPNPSTLGRQPSAPAMSLGPSSSEVLNPVGARALASASSPGRGLPLRPSSKSRQSLSLLAKLHLTSPLTMKDM